MGTYAVGILGKFSGAVGTVVGSTWKGISYMRMRGTGKRTGTSSQAQVEQQAKFKLVTYFLRPLKGLTDITFKGAGVNMTTANFALSSNLNKVITGVYPSFKIAYDKVSLSCGLLSKPFISAAIAGAVGKINFTWSDDSAIDSNANATDIVVLVAYCEEMNLSRYAMKAGSRSELTSSLDVTGFSGKSVETWLLLISADGKKVSDSAYTGQVTVL